jgi:Uma2 family endonuclease
MAVMVLDREFAESVLSLREEASEERLRDEVWDGVTFIMPEADNEHDDLVGFFRFAFRLVFTPEMGHRIHGSVNVSDRAFKWKQNYRVPDVSLFLAGNPSEDRKSHWFGGPDLAIEIVSPDDRSRDKLAFYAKVGTREVLVVDREPWQLELYQARRGHLKLVGAIRPSDGKSLTSVIGPLAFQLVRSRPRPKVKITNTETGQEWVG